MRRRGHTYAYRYPRTDAYPGSTDGHAHSSTHAYPNAAHFHCYAYQAASAGDANTPTYLPRSCTGYARGERFATGSHGGN